MGWRNTKHYRKWRAAVIRRDGVCQVCNSRKKRHAHHLNHAAYFIDKRFDVDNGICLCAKCHSIFHNKFHGSTRIKCTEKSYHRFILTVAYIKDLNENSIDYRA